MVVRDAATSTHIRAYLQPIFDPTSASPPGFTCTPTGGKDIKSYGFQALPWPPKSRRVPLLSACGTPAAHPAALTGTAGGAPQLGVSRHCQALAAG